MENKNGRLESFPDAARNTRFAASRKREAAEAIGEGRFLWPRRWSRLGKGLPPDSASDLLSERSFCQGIDLVGNLELHPPQEQIFTQGSKYLPRGGEILGTGEGKCSVPDQIDSLAEQALGIVPRGRLRTRGRARS